MMKKLFGVIAGLLVCIASVNPVFAEDNGKPPVEKLEQQFNQMMSLETTKDGKVKKYDSLGRLEQELKSIMTWPLADSYLDTYFYEENDKLYMEEMDGPLRLNTDEDYTLEKINDGQYKLTQQGHNELRDDYTLTIEYSYEAGKWVFADRNNQVGEDEYDGNNGGQLPNTATNLPMMALSGGALMALGAVGLFARRKFSTQN
ncbi:LPXTG cell wall anchor domain-containing protein [Pontibacillus yanchengensis]|uniref:Gram-positive cocci surface proteins LPxTG domain-containing protein n=1 Tax=Pontibacillus yanchengensis Y32 TaxID=1385514 RepID=A0A0A2TCN5_9BACI|nr:LPXTG cell wall anchor domain-containing protein [Pontibacillus yanchengensis]KGP73607.1 hypothetical protein N782_03915 [Pontibacillus yanchengensis Y32]